MRQVKREGEFSIVKETKYKDDQAGGEQKEIHMAIIQRTRENTVG